MLITDIKRVIEQVSREKGINIEVLISTIKEAVESAAKKKLGTRADIEVHYEEKSGEVEVFQFKEVVLEVNDPDIELTLKDGQQYDPACEIGDSLGIKVDTSEFGRIAAQSAKQVIIQKMKEAERNAVYENFIHKKGEIINGIVQRIDRGNIIVNLGQAEAVLTSREQMPRESYRRGDRIRAYILDVLEEARGSQVILSRTHPEFVAKLFATEVPEIAEGIVTIRGTAREAGVRSKIAVSSTDSDVDPVGACVGMKGNRVQSIVQELRGEKVDIVPWNPDVAKFVCNALAPAEIARVIIDEDNRSMEVIVPDDFLSIAIGKNGQNVRLACRLTGWHLEVMSEDEYSSELKQGYDSLMSIPGVSLALAEKLFKGGFSSFKDVSLANPGDLISVTDLSESDVEALVLRAKKMLEADHTSQVEDGDSEVQENEPEARENEVGQGAPLHDDQASEIVQDSSEDTLSAEKKSSEVQGEVPGKDLELGE
ncbi:NusA [Desulforapulum autotrophicum HRM2]|uniref:Transcription termination/antitermination protein NusA n=1 Tax=Desulforapulum autotrophicum (strain ATCC 43914 / DSM 3382 / VKM B-1955 / HRM2) TaxID=177437 RepID=C0QHM1_DESAH|nr:transcription termination factor NusA [Desulforapulum autotrophicum]ACN13579.1 NusA [Desulforapulum autotrophicum HRM2]